MRSYRSVIRFLTLLLFVSLKSHAQVNDPEKYDALKSVISNKDFRFIPQSATTVKGNTVQMDPGYILKLMTDSLMIDLPYFETGYSVAFGSTDDIIKFNSKQFTYSAETTKKGGWIINIFPKENTKIKRIHMNITPEGYCTLQLNITSKEPITYSGTMGDNFSR